MLLLLLIRLAGACPPEAVREDAVARAVERADEAIAALDVDALARATEALREAVACQAVPLTPALAADVHRVQGIDAFTTGDELLATTWFTASRALDPGATLGHDIGGPIQAAWDRSLPQTPPERAPLPAPVEGALFVDGAAADSRPAHLPFVFQRVEDGRVLQASLQAPDAALPSYPSRRERSARPWAAGAGVSGALSAAALVGAAGLRQRFNDPDRALHEVEGLVVPNRVLGGAGLALGATALGLGTVAVVRWER